MIESEFTALAKNLVAEYTTEALHSPIKASDVFIVWQCHILGNKKLLASTHLLDGMYYEITYDATKHQVYFDAYQKQTNIAITEEELAQY